MLAVLAMLIATGARAETEAVSFPVVEFSGETTELSATLTWPDGDGPFPAVVLLHGCSGNYPTLPWTEAFFEPLGIAALRIDSFGSRGIAGICDGRHRYAASPAVRARDAHAGKTFLAGLPGIDPGAIGVVGWSHGGTVVLASVVAYASDQPDRQQPFKAAVAFYPGCPTAMGPPDAPLLFLLGGADDWTPAATCQAMTLDGEPVHAYELVVYPGATHAFDVEGLSTEFQGHVLRYDPEAAAAAHDRMATFLVEHLQ